ncbi:STE/STE7/MEK1 protein kinase [Spizellomyces punctatus DAOM BR117]|uniref:mitogen-activated protein kinase kinase n=1 Tax=Spizellomyces punctatus (strain DAOM BR117) TaxID=645134 RepID=A0A0L0H5A8_SPIPD|nr:STE/STE7/MEK1 protein kinase [Spizellomyces punctatus DAOM BR117]KNC96076.1 STE/STE7/MEK1 protein kinase [Spizellomyces punctatus DAOM BR117]|eukprot:XP_016604116.1 STE/STE7/MEK1 protein kinase [Spizellomyces punctatus DAOM BR117]
MGITPNNSPGLSRRKPAGLEIRPLLSLYPIGRRKSLAGSESASHLESLASLSSEPRSGDLTPDSALVAAVETDIVGSQEVRYDAADFEFIAPLERMVAKVLHKPSGITMARKILPITTRENTPRAKERNLILRELSILRKLRSPYVVTFLGAYINEGDIVMLLEYMDLGSLSNVYLKTGPIEEAYVGKVAVQVLRGLCYLYDECHIVHRDIKPANLLLNRLGEVKISDFGVSKDLVESAALTFTGTQGYMAPERSCASMPITVISDIWSLGVTLMEIALAKFPYPPLTSVLDLIEFVQEGPTPSLPPGRFSESFEQFINLCLIKDPAQRPSPSVLLAEPFCANAIVDGLDMREWAESIATRILG